ncbi:hypothetical protein AB4Z40_34460 [Bosea sp. 2YAB26]|uniref:hypothetical protein n=1 Tax=Bosea sp. 2YAB26 TaxID=3237478 RepID=UPI003F91B51A
MSQGCGPEDAAKRAGLPNANRVYHFKKTQEFSIILRQALSKHLSDDLAPKAVAILDEIMSDKNVSPKVRADACRAVLDRAGFSATATGKPPVGGGRALNEMSVTELREMLHALEQQRAEEAKIVNGIVVLSDDAEDVDPME